MKHFSIVGKQIGFPTIVTNIESCPDYEVNFALVGKDMFQVSNKEVGMCLLFDKDEFIAKICELLPPRQININNLIGRMDISDGHYSEDVKSEVVKTIVGYLKDLDK